MTMSVAVSKAAAKHDHRVVQQAAVAVFRFAESLQEVSKLRDVERVDFLQISDFPFVVAVV